MKKTKIILSHEIWMNLLSYKYYLQTKIHCLIANTSWNIA
jgi:hypothetical protein